MQPFTTLPAATLIQMGSWNTHLEGEACTQEAHPPEDNSVYFGGVPPHIILINFLSMLHYVVIISKDCVCVCVSLAHNLLCL